MKSKQVIEVMEFTREYINDNSSGMSNRVREEYGETNFNQALDHAINCVGAIEQIKWERDIAIQQLNELGYEFGEKITNCKNCKFGSIVIDGGGREYQDCNIDKKILSPVPKEKCNYFADKE